MPLEQGFVRGTTAGYIESMTCCRSSSKKGPTLGDGVRQAFVLLRTSEGVLIAIFLFGWKIILSSNNPNELHVYRFLPISSLSP
jgi:hypothetical protein